jgi:hypothetical protein
MKLLINTLSAIAFLVWSTPSLAAPLPQKIGSCSQSFVKEVSYRLSSSDSNGVLIPIPGSGSAISFTNGGYQVSYNNVPAIHTSRRDDPVRICLTYIPDCSHARAGDKRGRIYLTTNLRKGASWELPDSAHQCGGA